MNNMFVAINWTHQHITKYVRLNFASVLSLFVDAHNMLSNWFDNFTISQSIIMFEQAY